MEFIEIAIIILLCVLSFLLGQKFNKESTASLKKNEGKYKSLGENEDDEEVFF